MTPRLPACLSVCMEASPEEEETRLMVPWRRWIGPRPPASLPVPPLPEPRGAVLLVLPSWCCVGAVTGAVTVPCWCCAVPCWCWCSAASIPKCRYASRMYFVRSHCLGSILAPLRITGRLIASSPPPRMPRLVPSAADAVTMALRRDSRPVPVDEPPLGDRELSISGLASPNPSPLAFMHRPASPPPPPGSSGFACSQTPSRPKPPSPHVRARRDTSTGPPLSATRRASR